MITVSMNKIYEESNIAIGNHLFQYCLCKIIALKNNYNFFIPSPGKLPLFFPDLDLGVVDGSINNSYTEDMNNQIFKSELFSLPDFTHLSGFFQTEKYFENYESEIKKWFKIDSLPNLDNNICLIQIRGGDNRHSEIALKLKWVLPKKYYLDGMSEVLKINPNTIFKIVTDDLELSKLYFPDLEILTNDTLGDFKLLISANYSIISSSTFAWWGRWLSDGITFAPNNWLNYNNPDLGFYPQDIKSKKFIYI